MRGRLAATLAGLACLSACATDTRYDGADRIAGARYVHDGPPALTLFTMINNRTGAGAHTSLMINASQRVIFDPAGSVSFSVVPENADILYGITPAVARAYESAHARETFKVAVQRIEVAPAVAEEALRLALENGAVAQAFCANATSSLLSKLDGFETISTTFYPNNLRDQFATLSGVTERVTRESDGDDKAVAIEALDAALAQR